MALDIQGLRRFKGENLDRIRYSAQLAIESQKWPVDEHSLGERPGWTALGLLMTSPVWGSLIGSFMPLEAAIATTCGLVLGIPIAMTLVGNRRHKFRQQARASLKLLEQYGSKLLAGTSVPGNQTEARFQVSRLRDEAVARAGTALSGMDSLITTTGSANQLAREALDGLGRFDEFAPAVGMTEAMTRDLDAVGQLRGRREAVSSMVRAAAPQDAPGLARLATRIHDKSESRASLADGLVFIARTTGHPIARALMECQHTPLNLRLAILGADRPDDSSHLTLADPRDQLLLLDAHEKRQAA